MAIKKYKPTSNGRRNMTSLDFAEITTNKPEKSLLEPTKRKAGRNNQGKITVRHHGGGHKKQYRVIDPIEALVSPFPKELTTPPVTNMCFVIELPSW